MLLPDDLIWWQNANSIDKVYDLDIRAGKTLVNFDEELNLVTQAEGSGDKWDADSLLRSFGV